MSKNIPKNKKTSERQYLLSEEVQKMCDATDQNCRYALRDKTLITMMFRHALRVGEVSTLKWSQISLKDKVLHVKRLKNGKDSAHPLQEDVIELLKQLKKETYTVSKYVFTSERKQQISVRHIRSIVKKLGEKAHIEVHTHPHMLRHGTGYHLVNTGQDIRSIQVYMGHASISNTVRYTYLDTKRFEGFWK